MYNTAERFHPKLAGLFGSNGSRVAHCLQGERVLRAQAHDHNPRSGDCAPRIKDGNLLPLALEITVGDEFADRATHSLIHCACCPFGPLDPFKQIDDDQLIFDGLNVACHHPNFHLRFSF